MKLVPDSVSRFSYRTVLKTRANSPTILVVAGVIGLGATAVLAAKATRNLDPILDDHAKARIDINADMTLTTKKDEQKALLNLYMGTGYKLTKLYGPALFVGSTSALAVLGGHKILRGRQIATMAAYSGLLDQFNLYRGRVAKTLGEEVEKGIYEGAHGEWVEDPENKGEYKLKPKFDKALAGPPSYLRPWFDERNVHWTRDALANKMFLTGVQSHMNNMLQHRGHVFLNDVFDALKIERIPVGQQAGWVWNSRTGDNFIDFGFMSSIDPHSVAFCNGVEKSVQLNFNIDGSVWDQI